MSKTQLIQQARQRALSIRNAALAFRDALCEPCEDRQPTNADELAEYLRHSNLTYAFQQIRADRARTDA